MSQRTESTGSAQEGDRAAFKIQERAKTGAADADTGLTLREKWPLPTDPKYTGETEYLSYRPLQSNMYFLLLKSPQISL
jgi:hypothetical protein